MTNDTPNKTSPNRISYETDGHICLIGLNRADKRNAFDSHMIRQLSEALGRYEADSELRCAARLSLPMVIISLQDLI